MHSPDDWTTGFNIAPGLPPAGPHSCEFGESPESLPVPTPDAIDPGTYHCTGYGGPMPGADRIWAGRRWRVAEQWSGDGVTYEHLVPR